MVEAKKPMRLEILQSHGGLVVVAKPPGMLVIPGRAVEDRPCLRDLLSEQLGTRIWVCHRIDRDTSGVVLFATDEQAHRSASMSFERGQAQKKYLSLVEGVVEEPMDIELPLALGRRGKMRISEGGKPARTLVRPSERFAAASMVECEPLTGRQHQIRVHLKARGHPLLFDHQYGRSEPLPLGDDFALARTPLHAHSLVIDALGIDVTAPLPEDMVEAMVRLRAGCAAGALPP